MDRSPGRSEQPTRGFDRVLLIGGICPDGLVPESIQVQRVTGWEVSPNRRLPVRSVIQWAQPARSPRECVLILTDLDLFIPECQSVFGFADARANVAVVSAFHLRRDCEVARWRVRMRNEIAHELWHLRGLRHCRQDGCLMRPVQHPAELETRSEGPCGRCPTSLVRRIASRLGRRERT